jgi:hypothetical protein
LSEAELNEVALFGERRTIAKIPSGTPTFPQHFYDLDRTSCCRQGESQQNGSLVTTILA